MLGSDRGQGETRLVYPCPHCGERLEVSEAKAGLGYVCPLCQAQTTVPVPPDSGSPQPAVAPPQPAVAPLTAAPPPEVAELIESMQREVGASGLRIESSQTTVRQVFELRVPTDLRDPGELELRISSEVGVDRNGFAAGLGLGLAVVLFLVLAIGLPILLLRLTGPG